MITHHIFQRSVSGGPYAPFMDLPAGCFKKSFETCCSGHPRSLSETKLPADSFGFGCDWVHRLANRQQQNIVSINLDGKPRCHFLSQLKKSGRITLIH